MTSSDSTQTVYMANYAVAGAAVVTLAFCALGADVAYAPTLLVGHTRARVTPLHLVDDLALAEKNKVPGPNLGTYVTDEDRERIERYSESLGWPSPDAGGCDPDPLF